MLLCWDTAHGPVLDLGKKKERLEQELQRRGESRATINEVCGGLRRLRTIAIY